MPKLSSHPVRSIPHPRYPTHVQVQADPDLLARHLPANWLGRRELAGAVGLALAIQSSGCTNDAAKPNGGATQGTRAGAIVAPIFEHGEGNRGESRRGIPVGIVLATPVFLSEEDALAVIRDQLATVGVNLHERNVTLPNLIIDGTTREKSHDWASDLSGMRTRRISGPLQLDLLDPARKIGIEFVSENDFGPLGGDWNGEYYDDLKQTAASLSEQVKRKGHDMRFAAFYDPMTYGAFEIESRNKAHEESKRLLRLQVQDFVNWLKAQGAI